jgi:hypothetical protein
MLSDTYMSGERSTYAMLMNHIPRYPCSLYVIQLRDRMVHVLEELTLEAGASEGRDLRLEVRRTRLGISRDRPRDEHWLDFMAPHRHLLVDVAFKSACTNTNVPCIGARLPLPGSLTLRFESSA